MLKKRRRGQIRAVDFVVSLFLFLLMLTQLILIIMNIQGDVTSSGISTISYEELDIFGRQLLEQEGDIFWGFQKKLPDSFGLADSTSSLPLALSASKIARLITGTSFPISVITGYEMYDYTSLKNVINMKKDYEFQIGFTPCLEVNLRSSRITGTDQAIAEVTITNFYNAPISNAQAYFYTIDLTNGDAIFEDVVLTNSTGGASIDYSIPNFDDPNNEHINIVIAKKEALWGINWAYYKSGLITGRVTVGNESNTTIWVGGVNTSSVLITDIIEITETPDNHFLSIIYENTFSGFSNITIDLGTSYDGNETILLPEKGLAFFMSIVKMGERYKVGIGSYPAILDRNSEAGIFYQVFGENNPRGNIKAKLSKIFPVVIRGTLMRCQLTMWRK